MTCDENSIDWGEYKLYDDESVKEKLKIMDKLEAMLDDERNPTIDTVRASDFLELGRTYKITMTFTRMS